MSHGGNIRQLREQAGEGVEVLDFSASINPLGFPVWLRAEISRNLGETIHYPDIDSKEFIETAAKVYNVSESEIIPANGTTELIFAIPRIFPLKKAIIPEPSYSDYRNACEKEDIKIKTLKLSGKNYFNLDTKLLDQELTKPSLVFLAHPNNPTGTLLDLRKIESVIESHPKSIFVIDEAYLSFSPDDEELSFIKYIHKFNNLIVLRSLTKFYALPGLRLGLAFSCKKLSQKIHDYLPPWSVNTLSQKVGTRAIQDINYREHTIELLTKCKEQLITELKGINKLKVYPTAANFVLCQLKSSISSSELFKLLIKSGIAIRDCSNFKHLDNTYFRVAIKSIAENKLLISALSSTLIPNYTKSIALKKKTPSLMLLGCSSNAGKSIIVSALCRILLQEGIKVAPYKSQNMALNSFVTKSGLEMGRAQAVQAQASKLEADIRMNPILLKPNTDTGSQVIVMGKPIGNMRVKEYIKYKDTAFKFAKDAYDSLAAEYDAIILEGAGSPGEINLKKHDIVNTRMAEYAKSPSVLVGDIDKGGIYASFIGMYETFEEWERKQVKGFLVNRFRGDATLLNDAHRYVKDFTGRDVLGVVPYIKDLGLPEEDSVSFSDNFIPHGTKDADPLDIALIALPHISNFTDFDALANEPDINIRIVKTRQDLGTPDCILLPGSKNVIKDLKILKDSGLAKRIIELSAERIVVGVCGGFQILGKSLSDPYNIEGGGSISGLNLLKINTTLAKEKTLIRTDAEHIISGKKVHGYEIHHGETILLNQDSLFKRTDGGIIGAGNTHIWGTYLHGVFDADGFRRYFINTIHKSLGRKHSDKIRYSYDLEPAFDRLAQTVRKSINMDEIYKLMGL